MKEIILTSRQKMLAPDRLAYELGQIQTPEKMENNKIVTYILIGAAATIITGFITYAAYQKHEENKRKKQN